MSKVTISVKGIADCQANLQQAVQNITAGSEVALDIVAGAILNDDVANCPVDTGLLQSEQQIYTAPLTRQIGSDVPYHIYVNNGTYKMAARPFTTNAFEANQGQLIPELQKIKVL